ncbi:alpha-L-rhamnosidase C-terminal domain-containing protein [Streptomyces tendae]|uniref:alpha-L-rhamnosidase C-terminal domain-containing protein n=1 Tax=Streptomyces tendae TaxID=1932 RepID=UPI003685B3D4
MDWITKGWRASPNARVTSSRLSPYGVSISGWRAEDRFLTYRSQVPANSTAALRIPATGPDTVPMEDTPVPRPGRRPPGLLGAHCVLPVTVRALRSDLRPGLARFRPPGRLVRDSSGPTARVAQIAGGRPRRRM